MKETRTTKGFQHRESNHPFSVKENRMLPNETMAPNLGNQPGEGWFLVMHNEGGANPPFAWEQPGSVEYRVPDLDSFEFNAGDADMIEQAISESLQVRPE